MKVFPLVTSMVLILIVLKLLLRLISIENFGTVKNIVVKTPKVLAKDFRRNRIVWFMHLPKAGGTSLNNLAMKNGEKFYYRGSANGNPLKSRKPTHKDHETAVRWNVENQIKVANMKPTQLKRFIQDAKDNGTSWIASEFHFPEANLLNDEVLYLLLLRNPVNRVVSQMNHWLRDRPKEITDEGFLKQLNKYGNHATRLLSQVVAQDNKLPDRTDLKRAFATLENVDLIMILEEPISPITVQLGWENSNLPHSNAKTRHQIDPKRKAEYRLKNILGDSWLEKLKRIVSKDQMIYDKAKMLMKESVKSSFLKN